MPSEEVLGSLGNKYPCIRCLDVLSGPAVAPNAPCGDSSAWYSATYGFSPRRATRSVGSNHHQHFPDTTNGVAILTPQTTTPTDRQSYGSHVGCLDFYRI